MPVNNPSSGGGGPHSIESHQSVVPPPRHGEALTYEYSEVDDAQLAENFEDQDNPVFPFTSSSWQVHWDTQYFYLENALASTNYDIDFTVEVPDNYADVRLSIDTGTVTGGSHYRTIEVYIDGVQIVNISAYTDIGEVFRLPLNPGTRTVRVRYSSEASGSVGVEEIYLNGLFYDYFVASEGATAEWQTRGFAKKRHRHDWDQVDHPLTFPPEIAGTPSEGDVVTYVSGVPTWAAP